MRLTVVGTEMFAAEIHAGSDAARVDWRSDYDALGYDVGKVPDDVRAGVLTGWNTSGSPSARSTSPSPRPVTG
ncbi:hypothetical protein [Streptomyces sp. NPDC018693]|uniref:hypothetical protein n=1 Tax=unclassified Streptomyces TaxID=2593676 RepID=UPI003796A14D